MAYITTDSVKEMRNQLKSLFPAKQGWKFSVTRTNYSGVSCTILTAPIELRNDLTRTHQSVNHYYIQDNYSDNKPAADALSKINDILNLNNYDNSDSMSDYFDVGHYVSMSIGDWDKPFVINN